jgi:predicted Zn-dependent protease
VRLNHFSRRRQWDCSDIESTIVCVTRVETFRVYAETPPESRTSPLNTHLCLVVPSGCLRLPRLCGASCAPPTSTLSFPTLHSPSLLELAFSIMASNGSPSQAVQRVVAAYEQTTKANLPQSQKAEALQYLEAFQKSVRQLLRVIQRETKEGG